MNTAPLAPDRAEILRALAVLFPAPSIIELRAFPKRGKQVAVGYFDYQHRDALADAAVALNEKGASCYVTLNALDPQLLGRYHNRLEVGAPTAATDANVTRRRWLLIDLDPARPKDTAATDQQLAAAKHRAAACISALRADGWPEPVVALSGNGAHLLYRIDLPNDNASRDLVKGALAGLAARFDDGAAKVDQAVFNAARITKLYGTVATKGDNTEAAPWRLSRLVKVPEQIGTVTAEQLRALHQSPGTTAPPGGHATGRPGPHDRAFDLDEFLARLGIPYSHDVHDGRDRYRLAYCPFNPEHKAPDSAIFRASDGRLGFKCLHTSCASHDWHALRELVDGPRSRSRGSAGRAAPPDGDAQDAGEAWPEPLPLKDDLAPVAPFNLALLPDGLRPWAADIIERVQCAPDFVGAAIMAALAGAVGRRIAIRPQAQTDWAEVPNLWALIVGRPGVLKSPAIEAALGPLKRLQALAVEEYTEAAAAFAAEQEAAGLRKDANRKAASKILERDSRADVSYLLNAEQAEAPTLRRYLANDTTAAALGELLRQNPSGLLVHRDEMVSLLRALDREDAAAERGFYLTAWAGNSAFTFDRIGRGLNLHIPAVCLSLLGSTQPARLAEYVRQAVRGGAGDDGLIQRFGLLVWPDQGGDWQDVDRWPDGDARRAAHAVFERLATLDPRAVGALQDTGPDDQPEGLPYLRFSPAGLDIFREWRTDLETRLRGNDLHPALESHLAKFRKLVPALALLIHLADGGAGPVDRKPALQALAWAQFLETHARRAYGAVTMPEAVAARLILRRLRSGDLASPFSSRDVWRPGWTGLSDRATVADALALLCDLDWLRTDVADDTGGRPATRYTAHPRALP